MEESKSGNLLILKDKEMIAKGNRQYVYEHPNDPGTLLKIPQAHTMDENFNLLSDTWFDRLFRRSTGYKGFLREFRESLDLMVRHQRGSSLIPVSEVRGVIQTDLGLALLYERISDPDGTLSPSLHDLAVDKKISQQHVDDLHTYFALLASEHVAINNKNLRNIVYQTWPDGSGRWVWIDSFGCKQTIPLRRWSRKMNARKLEQIRDRFVAFAEDALRKNTST